MTDRLTDALAALGINPDDVDQHVLATLRASMNTPETRKAQAAAVLQAAFDATTGGVAQTFTTETT